MLNIINNTDGTVNKRICSDCGGKCCKQAPGLVSPNDFPNQDTMVQDIADLLLSGRWAIDWWDGDPRDNGDLCQVYYLRPAIVHYEGIPQHPSWGGPCTFFNEGSGCDLAFANRPLQCRQLIPNYDGCTYPSQDYSKKSVVILWIPFQDQIKEALSLCQTI